MIKKLQIQIINFDSFLDCRQIADLNHSVASPMSFKVEYRRGTSGPAMFQRHVRFNVDIAAIGQHEGKGDRCAEVDVLYAVTFVLIAGAAAAHSSLYLYHLPVPINFRLLLIFKKLLPFSCTQGIYVASVDYAN